MRESLRGCPVNCIHHILSTADIGLNFCFSLLQSNLSGHKNIIGYVDSSITHTGNGVYEVLLLMPYCKVNMLGMMNSRYMTRFCFCLCLFTTLPTSTSSQLIGCRSIGAIHKYVGAMRRSCPPAPC